MPKIQISKNYLLERFNNITTIDARTDLGKFKKTLYHLINNYDITNRNLVLNNLVYLEDMCEYIKMGTKP